MSSTYCPQCGLVNFATDEKCKRCSASLIVQSHSSGFSIPDRRSMDCQHCGGAETRSFDMAYASSTSSGTFVGGSYNLSMGATVMGGVTTQQSQLAMRVRPPVMAGFNTSALFVVAIIAMIVGFIFMVFFASAGYPAFGFLLLAGIPLGVGAQYYRYELGQVRSRFAQYSEALAGWRRSWICLRCGHSWFAGRSA